MTVRVRVRVRVRVEKCMTEASHEPWLAVELMIAAYTVRQRKK